MNICCGKLVSRRLSWASSLCLWVCCFSNVVPIFLSGSRTLNVSDAFVWLPTPSAIIRTRFQKQPVTTNGEPIGDGRQKQHFQRKGQLNDDEDEPDGNDNLLDKSTFRDDKKGGPSNLFVSGPTKGWILERIESADGLEIRQDATLAACYVLSRFLIYDVATGAKVVPGWELQDWVRILSTMSSAIVLAVFWTLSGLLVTQIFESSSAERHDEGQSSSSWVALTMVNVLVATPLWLIIEQALHFGPPGIETAYNSDIYLATGSGLASIMLLAKLATGGWK